MTSHTGSMVAAPAWGAFREARRSPGGGRVRESERAGAADLSLKVRGWTGRGVAAFGLLMGLWAVLWAVFLLAVAIPAASARAVLDGREAARAEVASASGSRP